MDSEPQSIQPEMREQEPQIRFEDVLIVTKTDIKPKDERYETNLTLWKNESGDSVITKDTAHNDIYIQSQEDPRKVFRTIQESAEAGKKFVEQYGEEKALDLWKYFKTGEGYHHITDTILNSLQVAAPYLDQMHRKNVLKECVDNSDYDTITVNYYHPAEDEGLPPYLDSIVENRTTSVITRKIVSPEKDESLHEDEREIQQKVENGDQSTIRIQEIRKQKMQDEVHKILESFKSDN